MSRTQQSVSTLALCVLLSLNVCYGSLQVVKNNPNLDRLILVGSARNAIEAPLGFDHISAIDLVQFLDHEMTSNMEMVQAFKKNQLIKNYGISTLLSKVKNSFIVKIEGTFPTDGLVDQPIAEFELVERQLSSCVDTASCFAKHVEAEWRDSRSGAIDACIQSHFSDIEGTPQLENSTQGSSFLAQACDAIEFTFPVEKHTGVYAWNLTLDQESAIKVQIVKRAVNHIESVFRESGKYNGFIFASHSKQLVHSDDFSEAVLAEIEGVLSYTLDDEQVLIETGFCNAQCREALRELFKNDSLYRMRMLETEASDNATGEEGNNGEESNTVSRMIMGWTGFLIGIITLLSLGGILLADQARDTLLYSKFLTVAEVNVR